MAWPVVPAPCVCVEQVCTQHWLAQSLRLPGRGWPTNDDQAGIGVDDDLVVGRVLVVLGLLRHRVVPGWDQGAVHDEHGVLGEPLAGFEREHRPQVVDDAVRCRLGHPEEWGELAHCQVRAPVRRDQQSPVLQREAPWPALADRIRTLAPQYGHQLAEQARAQPGERG